MNDLPPKNDQIEKKAKRKSKNNPTVFIEFATRKKKLGKIVIELFDNKAPKTVANFLAIITQQNNNDYTYKGCNVHRIIPDFMIQTGDFTKGDGSGGTSIYGRYFEDETFSIKHDSAGLLSMANAGPNTNGSQFFITLNKCPWLDGKHVVFGQVLEGLDVARKIESFGTPEGKPTDEIRIVNCGQLE